MAMIRNWIGSSLKSYLHHIGRWQWEFYLSRSMSTTVTAALPVAAFSRALTKNSALGQGVTLTHAHSGKVKFLGVFVGFVDDSKRRRQYDKALEKRRRVIHRLRQLQKQRQESWEKHVQHLAFNAFTRAYRKTLNTLRSECWDLAVHEVDELTHSGSKAKQAIFDKATELGTKAALTLTDQHPLMTSNDLKKLLEQEEDHFSRLGWEYLPISVKTAYENLMLSIEEACEDLKGTQIAESRPPAFQHHLPSSDHEQPEFELATEDLNHPCEDVMERLADPETLSVAYGRIKSKLQVLSGKSDEAWNDLSMSFFDHMGEKLQTGTYQFSPVSQIHVRRPGKEGAARTILVVNPRDQIVAEAVRAELERMYTPVFFKLARSCHMALKLVKSTWKGTTWFLHYKAPIAFGKLQHENLLRILSVRVKDEEFLCLLQRMFKMNVINMGDQGNRLSALLCNIYYHQLDLEVTRMQAELNTGSNKRNVIQYDEEINAPYARVRYARYAEEFLFGITGSKAMALEVLERVHKFLRHELKLHGP